MRNWVLLVIFLGVVGCSTTTVKSTDITPLKYASSDVSEDKLLDIGVIIFEPGIDELLEQDNAITLPEIRRAESRFMPFRLSETLQQNGSWGAVRVIPNDSSMVDLYVSGEILHSDGEKLEVSVTVKDSSGRPWYTREYEEVASRYSYDDRKRQDREPFQGMYNRIANDMLKFRDRLSSSELARIRTISELKFAESFSPEVFVDYMVQDSKGRYQVMRLPPDNDPVLQRVRQIRERDYLFIDTLQDYYSSFALEMEGPYQEWRRLSYDEVVALRELRRESRNAMLAGAAALIIGVAAAGSSDGAVRQAGTVGVLGGAYLIKSGLDKRTESQIHIEALQELGGSLEAEIEPQVIQLEDRTVTLSGTVDNQYDQWRGILKEIYVTETGDAVPAASAN